MFLLSLVPLLGQPAALGPSAIVSASIAPSAGQVGTIRARARTNLAALISPDDYPIEAIRKGEQGEVTFRLNVGSNGRVSGCAVTKSSGSAVLDAATCRLMAVRSRFSPARDQSGKPVEDVYTFLLRWVLPVEYIPRTTTLFVTLQGRRPARAFLCRFLRDGYDMTDPGCEMLSVRGSLHESLAAAQTLSGRNVVGIRLVTESLVGEEQEASAPRGARLTARRSTWLEVGEDGRVQNCVPGETVGIALPDTVCVTATWFDPARLGGRSGRSGSVRMVEQLWLFESGPKTERAAEAPASLPEPTAR